MARSDLLLALVKAGLSGDKNAVRSAAEAVIAEERVKQHTVLADRLARLVQNNGNGNGNGGQHASTFDTGRSRDFIVEKEPLRRLEDIALSISCRETIYELIEEQRRSDVLRAHGLEPRHRVLFVGPPGNGKTTLAEALAESLNVPFFVVRYEAIIGSYLGETASRLKRVFDYARTTPCVLFFDEFDAIGKERGDIHETGEIKRVVTSLLMQIDDLPSYTMIVAATNHSELLDRAAWRRFQIRIELPQPSQIELTHYFEEFISQFGEPFGFTAGTIAKRLPDISYAEAEQFCLNVRRSYVLGLGEKVLKEVVSEQLRAWSQLVPIGPVVKKQRGRKNAD